MATSPTLQVGAEIERRRILLGLTAPEVARRAGISCPYMRLLEREKYSARPPTLLRVAGVLGCEVGDFIRQPANAAK